MLNTLIGTKFPESDIQEMDNLIDKGIFISRSDIVRMGTRKIIEEAKKKKSEKDKFVLAMEKGAVFKNPELRLLAELQIKPPLSKKDLSETEQKMISRLLRKPLKPIKIIKKKIYLTETGTDLAEGFLDALLHLEKTS